MSEKIFKTWQKRDEYGIKVGVNLYVDLKKICAWREGIVPMACACTLDEFLCKTDDYDMQGLIREVMGGRTLVEVRKVAKLIEEQNLSFL